MLEVTDGRGWVHRGQIDVCRRDQVVLTVQTSQYTEPQDVKLRLAVSLLKGKAMHFVVERLTEIGIGHITPVIFNRTDVQNFEDRKPQKWTRIAEQAIKISDNPWLPKIDAPVQLSDLLDEVPGESIKLLFDLEGETEIKAMGNIDAPVLFVVGPPGGITDSERELLKSSGFRSIKMSQWTFRSETAALFSAVWLKMSMSDEGQS